MLIEGPPPQFKGFTSVLPKCELCKAYKQCKSPKMEVGGKGKKRILIVGEVPTKTDDKRGKHFAGESGQLLRDELTRNGISLRNDCWTTNAMICKPKGPWKPEHVDACRPNLLKTIRELKPRLIILLGPAAIRALIPHVWNQSAGEYDRWYGYRIPARNLKAWVCPVVPALSMLKAGNENAMMVARGQFSRQIAACLKLPERPPECKPEQDEIEIIQDRKEASEVIRSEMKKGGLSAFDYETNMLKPDGSDAEIATCSICFRGERTIAYPWSGSAIKATREYLRSDLPKVGSNIKFEHRWTKAKLKINVRNWVWDTMQAAHVLDNRPGVTSVKYQSFVRLGTPIYNSVVERYLTDSPGPGQPNRVWKAPLRELLIYNAIDSLVEWRVAIHQAEEMGITLPGV